jgi:biofilm protein TabA
MILSSLDNGRMLGLLALAPAFRVSLDWMLALGSDGRDGVTELNGRKLYANVHGYNTKARERCCWESHRHTADVQLCLSGGETIDWLPGIPLSSPAHYDPDRDFETWPNVIGSFRTVNLTPGDFVVFLPGEVHRPMIHDGQNMAIRKVVAKIDACLLPECYPPTFERQR